MTLADYRPRAGNPQIFGNRSGWYWIPNSPRNSTTSAVLGNGFLRLSAFWLPVPASFAAMGGEVTIVGDAGSTVRIGLYRSGADMLPLGAPVAEGTIAGDAVAVADITLGSALVLLPGLYWFGGVVQGVTVTQPTVRVLNDPVPWGGFSAKPSAGQGSLGVQVTGVTAALPTITGATSIGTTSSVPRCHLKVA